MFDSSSLPTKERERVQRLRARLQERRTRVDSVVQSSDESPSDKPQRNSLPGCEGLSALYSNTAQTGISDQPT